MVSIYEIEDNLDFLDYHDSLEDLYRYHYEDKEDVKSTPIDEVYKKAHHIVLTVYGYMLPSMLSGAAYVSLEKYLGRIADEKIDKCIADSWAYCDYDYIESIVRDYEDEIKDMSKEEKEQFVWEKHNESCWLDVHKVTASVKINVSGSNFYIDGKLYVYGYYFFDDMSEFELYEEIDRDSDLYKMLSATMVIESL